MTEEGFQQVVRERCDTIVSLLAIKGKEYRRKDNPFHNFERGAKITNETPFEVLDGFLLKHLISYRDMLNDIKEGKIPSLGLVEEKFGDIINYFVLQEAQIKNLIEENE